MLIDDLKRALCLRAPADNQLERVAQHAVRITLDEGELLFPARTGEARYLLLRGQIKLFRLGPNEKRSLRSSRLQHVCRGVDVPRATDHPVGAQTLQAAEVISVDARILPYAA